MSDNKLIQIIVLPILLAGLVVLAINAADLFKPRAYIGDINGRKISQSEFDQINTRNRLQAMIRYGKLFESLEPVLDLSSEAWDQVILLNEAKARKIKVSDQDVINAVAEYPFFFRKEKFDPVLYRDIIRNSLKAEPQEFEASVRQRLLIERLRDQVTGSITVTDEQLLAEFQKRKDIVQVESALVADKDFSEGITVSDDEAKTYFDSHAADFEMGESVRIQYIWMPFPPDGGVQKQVETKYKGKAIIDRHVKNKIPLQEAAQSMKFEMKETGFFSRDNAPQDTGIDWTKERLATVFQMKTGDISQPIEQKDAYSVIKMIEKKQPSVPAFEDVKTRVIETVKSQKVREAAVKKTQELIAQIQTQAATGADFKTAATTLGLKVEESKLTQREKLFKTLAVTDDAKDALAQTPVNTIAPVITSENGALIVKVTKLYSAKEDDLKKSLKSFRDTVINEKKDKLFDAFLKDLRRTSKLKKY